MQSFGTAYHHVLDPLGCKALEDGLLLLLDERFEDLIPITHGSSVRETGMAFDLPAVLSHHYTPAFARQWLITLSTLAWKLAQPKSYLLTCVAEELAGWAAIRAAKEAVELALSVVDDRGSDDDGDFDDEDDSLEAHLARTGITEIDFSWFEDEFFEDWDVLVLFDAAADGFPASPVGKQILHMTPMDFADWFRPFLSPQAYGCIHPYCDAEQAKENIGQAFHTVVSDDEQQALVASFAPLLDEGFDSIILQQSTWNTPNSFLTQLFPPQYAAYYTPVVAKTMLFTLATVGWKLAQPHRYPVSNLAEALALRAWIHRASALLHHKNHHQPFKALERVLFKHGDPEDICGLTLIL